jgi:hypothetical protein
MEATSALASALIVRLNSPARETEETLIEDMDKWLPGHHLLE